MKKEKKIIKNCPSCGVDLDEDTIRFFENANNLYKVKLTPENYLDYEFDEVVYVHDTSFICRECGANLHLREQDVVEILKSKNKEQGGAE